VLPATAPERRAASVPSPADGARGEPRLDIRASVPHETTAVAADAAGQHGPAERAGLNWNTVVAIRVPVELDATIAWTPGVAIAPADPDATIILNGPVPGSRLTGNCDTYILTSSACCFWDSCSAVISCMISPT
jgi:hypothetical protein